MRAAPIVVCLALFSGAPLGAADQLSSEGYGHFYNLEYDQAIADFTAETEQYPNDPSAWNHVAHAILYRAMFRSGALESQLVTGSNPFLRREKVQTTPAEDQEFFGAIDKSLQLCQKQLSSSPHPTHALSAQGVAYALRANYNFLVRKAWLDALHDATRANDSFKRLLALEPANVDARLIPGVYDYTVGSLPWGYRILGFLAGFHGNRTRGIQTIQTVVREGKTDRVDAEILLAVIYRREHRSAEAIPLLDDLIRQFPRNYLLHFEVVQMYSDLGDRDKAMAQIDRIWQLHRSGAQGFANLLPEKIDYLEGNFLFWYNDLAQASEHLRKAAAEAHELDLNTAIMSWLRLGQIYDLEGRRPAAMNAYRVAVAMAPSSEVAKEARGYLSSPYRREQAAATPARQSPTAEKSN